MDYRRKEWFINFLISSNGFTNFTIRQNHINGILQKGRYIIAHYIKNKYILEDISEEGKNKSFTVDELNFISIDNPNLWVLGAINTTSRK